MSRRIQRDAAGGELPSVEELISSLEEERDALQCRVEALEHEVSRLKRKVVTTARDAYRRGYAAAGGAVE